MSGSFVRPIARDKHVKFGDPRLKTSREISPKPSHVAFSRVFGDSFRPEVVSDVISGMAAEQFGVDVPVKFGDSRSNRSRDARAAHVVMGMPIDGPCDNRAKYLITFCLKMDEVLTE